MSVTFSGDRARQIIQGIRQKMESPDLIVELGNSMAANLVGSFNASGLTSQSGATVRALSKVGEPERTANGWRIGVGDGEAAGKEGQPAPRGTLRAFYDYIEGGLEGYAGATGRVHKYTDWWGMSSANKRLLEQGRRAGLFGGRGPDYANYLWVQDKGNARARITAKPFIDIGVGMWRESAPDIVNRHFNA